MEWMELGISHAVCAGDNLAFHTPSIVVLLRLTGVSRRRLGGEVGTQAAGGAGVGAEPAAIQQRLQGILLGRPRLAAEAGATALRVDAARVAFAQRASQAAAAAGFSHQLRARGRGGWSEVEHAGPGGGVGAASKQVLSVQSPL